MTHLLILAVAGQVYRCCDKLALCYLDPERNKSRPNFVMRQAYVPTSAVTIIFAKGIQFSDLINLLRVKTVLYLDAIFSE